MQKLCINCNQTNPAEAMFCRHCASPLGAGQPQQQQQMANPQQFGQQQQQWNQPNFGNQQQQVARVSGGSSGRAMASAGLAVAALLCCGFFTGIPAAILGWLEISAIKEGKAPADGMMMAQVGLWLGIIGSVINAILNFIALIFLNLGGGY